jgi:hypothetical protein
MHFRAKNNCYNTFKHYLSNNQLWFVSSQTNRIRAGYTKDKQLDRG